MPYNLGMTQLTLALPFALPPAEMAPDLLRVLKAPALAALLSRRNRLDSFTFDNPSRVLPHEAWLAHQLGLAPAPQDPAAAAPLATAVLRSYGHAPAGGYWFIVHPAHVQISRTHMLLSDQRQLRMEESESRALFDLARPCFEEVGKTLAYGDAATWFMRADDWSGLRTASADATLGQSLSDWLPEGEHAREYRKLQNEVQMQWHEHPSNEARQARGLQPINAFWIWGGASADLKHPLSATAAASSVPATTSSNQLSIASSGAPAWMSALAEPLRRQPLAEQLITQAAAGQPQTVMLADLIPDAVAGDWAAWLAHVHRIEQDWFVPLLAAIKDGRLRQLKLVLSHRDGWAEITTSKSAQRKFWRAINLNTLLNAA